jgi:hypothetical protein
LKNIDFLAILADTTGYDIYWAHRRIRHCYICC